MICPALQTIGIPMLALVHGDGMIDPTIHRSHDDTVMRGVMHRGKEASMLDSLAGGNGFAVGQELDPSAPAAYVFDEGVIAERRDLRSFKIWSRDLDQCRMDKARGATA